MPTRGMVSRSLEKMILIAVGLTMAVTIGVPVLLYSIDLVNQAGRIESGRFVAERMQDAIELVDGGAANMTTLDITLPPQTSVSASGHTFTVTLEQTGGEPIRWTREFNHTLVLTPPTGAASYRVTIGMEGSTIMIVFERTRSQSLSCSLTQCF